MRDDLTHDVSMCSVCQKQKKQHKKYGLLPERKLNINHGNDYVSISLVLTKYKQRNVVTKYQN